MINVLNWNLFSRVCFKHKINERNALSLLFQWWRDSWQIDFFCKLYYCRLMQQLCIEEAIFIVFQKSNAPNCMSYCTADFWQMELCCFYCWQGKKKSIIFGKNNQWQLFAFAHNWIISLSKTETQQGSRKISPTGKWTQRYRRRLLKQIEAEDGFKGTVKFSTRGYSTPSGVCFSAETFVQRGWQNLSSLLCLSLLGSTYRKKPGNEGCKADEILRPPPFSPSGALFISVS